MRFKIQTIAFLVLLVSLSSCVKKEFTEPDSPAIPTGTQMTIAQLRQFYQDSVVNKGLTSYRFTEDYSVYAVVTMDDKMGNIYKSAYIQDNTGALNLHLLSSGGLYQGDSIRLYLKGTILGEYHKMQQLDSVNVDKNIVKLKNDVTVQPKKVKIIQLSNLLQGQLIQLDDVEFKDTGRTYADADNLTTENRILKDCYGHEVNVRTSGYASFADEKVPTGYGSIIAIAGQYDSETQLYIRSPKEVTMTNPYCFDGTYMSKNFDDGNLTSWGWTTQKVEGCKDWKVESRGGKTYAVMSNYDGTNYIKSDVWLISPAVDLSSSTAPILTFKNACNYDGDAIKIKISVDYDGHSTPSTATWSNLPANLSPGNWSWVSSGDIDLSAYKSQKVYIAIEYIGSDSSGKTWEIDNIYIKENN